jgi:hypothetical protein
MFEIFFKKHTNKKTLLGVWWGIAGVQQRRQYIISIRNNKGEWVAGYDIKNNAINKEDNQ